MSIDKKEVPGDSKPGDISPSLHCTDVEIGTVQVKPKDADSALEFLRNAHDVGALTPESERKLLRKIDWMIMPLMSCCYTLQYLDKTLGMILCFTIKTHLTCFFFFHFVNP